LPSAHNKIWPKILHNIIQAIKKASPQQPTQPKFSFKLTSKAAEKNYLTLMRKYKGSLADSLEAQCNLMVDMALNFVMSKPS
jgi:hypothetical protein